MTRDSDISERIRKGDAGQFESLFRSSYPPLVRYALTLVKDQDAAEEIVQDFFVKLWQEKEKIKIENSLNGYLFKSVYNRCLHYIDHKKVVLRHAEEMLNSPEESSESPADILHYRELLAKIAGILERLPERCGKIFYMSRFDGLRYSEIAERLSVSVKTVEADMGRALKEFRKELSE
jgi:RNA polymerase sigma-70 factor (ECF subfamily)